MLKSYLKYNIAVFFIILILALSCTKNNNNIKDRYGNDIILPKHIESIISLSPAITEILIDLNISDKITASDSYSKDILLKYNNNKYQDLITFDLASPDAEKLIALNPDIVLVNSLSLFSGSESFRLTFLPGEKSGTEFRTDDPPVCSGRSAEHHADAGGSGYS